ncbi:MAG TPA: squalene synthase HpnC [Xanthobacteraceae bacterium]|jgi:squalene synthase HpnC|nr:squalene synthase HpnC [Xanthobacteraceae bacterium]
MTNDHQVEPTKTHRGENFPVASLVIDRRHRGIILDFYRFVRAADDIADHPTLAANEKLARLDDLEHALLGQRDDVAVAFPLRKSLSERGLSPRHAQDLLTAFRMDVTKLRYSDWDDLIGYCTYSAMPVGRFVLDVHGESKATWPASDALCAALQIINHLQDCGADYKNIDRVYVPLDYLARHRLSVEALGGNEASPALRACITELARRTAELLKQSKELSAQTRNLRLALEISIIQRLAETLVEVLKQRDPLSQRVHLNKAETFGVSLAAMIATLGSRAMRRFHGAGRTAQDA